jgi:hypothetical protein
MTSRDGTALVLHKDESHRLSIIEQKIEYAGVLRISLKSFDKWFWISHFSNILIHKKKLTLI